LYILIKNFIIERKDTDNREIYQSKSFEETVQIGESLGEKLNGGELILLNGRLGSGKTCFTKGLAKALSVEDIITSPSFTLMNVYRGSSLTLYHLDLYRIESNDTLIDYELEEYFTPDSVVVIEWGDRLEEMYDLKEIIEVQIEVLDEDQRQITINKLVSS